MPTPFISKSSAAFVVALLFVASTSTAKPLDFKRAPLGFKPDVGQVKEIKILKSLIKKNKRKALKSKKITLEAVNNALKKSKKGSRGSFKALTLKSKIAITKRKGARGKAEMTAEEYLKELNKWAPKFAAEGFATDGSGPDEIEVGEFDSKKSVLAAQRASLSKKFGAIKALRVLNMPSFAAARGKKSKKLYLLPKTKYTKGLPKAAKSRSRTPSSYTWDKTETWGPYGDKSVAAIQLEAGLKFFADKDKISLTADASVDTWIFSKKKTLFSAKGELKGDNKAAGGKGEASVNLTANVLGKSYTIYSKKAKGVSKSDSKSYQKSWSTKFRFTLGPIPMSVTVGAAFETGIRYEVALKPTQATASVTPFIQSDAFCNIAVDIVVASAGVEGRATLVDAEFELHGSAGIAGDSNGLYAYAGLAADLGLQALNGVIKIFAKVNWCLVGCTKKYSWKVFNWDGFSKNWRLFSVEKKVYIIGQAPTAASPKPSFQVAAGPITPTGKPVLGYWGKWASQFSKCPKGSFAVGFRQRVEKKQGKKDDTALNSVQLRCRNPKTNATEDIRSSEGFWGDWSSWAQCPKGHFLTSFRMRVEKKQRKKDDTAANDVEFTCSNGNKLVANKRGPWGTWRDGQNCTSKGYINGFKTRIEGKRGKKRDDTAMNGLEISCAPR